MGEVRPFTRSARTTPVSPWAPSTMPGPDTGAQYLPMSEPHLFPLCLSFPRDGVLSWRKPGCMCYCSKSFSWPWPR